MKSECQQRCQSIHSLFLTEKKWLAPIQRARDECVPRWTKKNKIAERLEKSTNDHLRGKLNTGTISYLIHVVDG